MQEIPAPQISGGWQTLGRATTACLAFLVSALGRGGIRVKQAQDRVNPFLCVICFSHVKPRVEQDGSRFVEIDQYNFSLSDWAEPLAGNGWGAATSSSWSDPLDQSSLWSFIFHQCGTDPPLNHCVCCKNFCKK